MLLLSLMLLLGLAAVVWGFLMCFAPAKWASLTEFGDLSTTMQATSQHPVVRIVIRVGNSIAGLGIFAVGAWFSYVAGSEIYLVLLGRTTLHPLVPRTPHHQGSLSLPLTLLSISMAVAGSAMALLPDQILRLVNTIGVSGQSMKTSMIPKVRVFLRIFGIILVALAIMSLFQ
jgi:hypothetical protein